MNDFDKNVFSSCEIKWVINNFCFAHPPNGYAIFSPEFVLQGVKTVKWRMSLELENNESCNDGQLSFYLEKLPISMAKRVFVNWEMSLTAGIKTFGPHEDTVEFNEQSKHGQINIASTAEIFDLITPDIPDTLIIHFSFVAYDKDLYFTPEEEQREDGLLDLSNDMYRLKIEGIYTDIKINVSDRCINAHKAILSLNEKLDTYVREAKNDVIVISDIDYETLDAFLNYLYSEKIKYLRDRASLSVIRCLEHFDCDALKSHCVPEAIKMESKVSVETHEFHWYVADVLDKNEFTVTSPSIKAMHTTWKLTLSSKSKDPKQYISLYAKIADGKRPSQFCLEFSLLNESGKELLPRRLVRTDGCCDNMGFDDFVSNEKLNYHKSLTIKGALCIIFRAKTSTGKQEARKGRQTVTFVSPVREEKYRKLSEKVENLLHRKIRTDFILHVNDTVSSVKAHKCIVAARSPELRSRIEQNLIKNSLLYIKDISPDLLEHMVNYIYSGTLSAAMKTNISRLYNLSAENKLNIPSLRADSLRYMRSAGMHI